MNALNRSYERAEGDQDRISAAFEKRWADELSICQAIGKEPPTEAAKVLAARLFVQGWFDARTAYKGK